MSTATGRAVARALIDLSDVLVTDYDVLDFLHLLTRRCVDLLGVRAAGVMIADRLGGLRVMAASSEQAPLLELFEVEAREGPSVACHALGVPVSDPDRRGVRRRRSGDPAGPDGFPAVHAVPVRLRDDTIGVLTLFATGPDPLDDTAADIARALANATAVGLLQHRAVEYRQILAEQLQAAVNDRVVTELAKGVLAEHLDLDMAAAFDELRRFARRCGLRLAEAAVAVAERGFGTVGEPGGRTARVLLIRRFRLDALIQLRADIAIAAAAQGLDPRQVAEFLLAVHEAAGNAVRHGGGAGQLLLWLAGGDLFAEISDNGPGMGDGDPADPAVAAGADRRPGDSMRPGHGLELIRRICADVKIDTGPGGTRVLLRYPLDSPGATGDQAGG